MPRGCRLHTETCSETIKLINYQHVSLRLDENNNCTIYGDQHEPVREKTNNLGSDQVLHKSGCTVTDDS